MDTDRTRARPRHRTPRPDDGQPPDGRDLHRQSGPDAIRENAWPSVRFRRTWVLRPERLTPILQPSTVADARAAISETQAALNNGAPTQAAPSNLRSAEPHAALAPLRTSRPATAYLLRSSADRPRGIREPAWRYVQAPRRHRPAGARHASTTPSRHCARRTTRFDKGPSGITRPTPRRRPRHGYSIQPATGSWGKRNEQQRFLHRILTGDFLPWSTLFTVWPWLLGPTRPRLRPLSIISTAPAPPAPAGPSFGSG